MVYHMKAIAEHFEQSSFLVLDHQPKIDVLSLFGDDLASFFGCAYQVVKPEDMLQLDGSFAAVVCPNPFPGMEYLHRTRCIGMQYSMAKDRYVNGPWRAMFDMTMTYGRYSAERIAHYCPTAPVGNPRFERWFADPTRRDLGPLTISLDRSRPAFLYLPTWGEFSSVDLFMNSVMELSSAHNVLIKVHHKTDTHEARRKEAVASRAIYSFGAMDDLLPLLDVADVVLSDYSGAIFDAIYVRKPIVLLQSDPASVIGRKFGFESIEYSRRDEIGPVVSSPNDLADTLASVVSGSIDFKAKNEGLRSEVFEYDQDSGAIAAQVIVDFVSKGSQRPLYQTYLGDELKDARLRRRKEQENLKQLQAGVKALRREVKVLRSAAQDNSAARASVAHRTLPEQHYDRGVVHEQNRRWKAAETEYRRALSYDANRADWLARLGYVLEQDEQWPQAVAAFEAALRKLTISA
jgi:tetratricopeptide (TPR) repeat protein